MDKVPRSLWTLLLGLMVGGIGSWVIFRAPEWACGPFRAEKSAEWAGVLVSMLAAALTLIAIVTGLRSAEKAIQSERLMRKEERDHALDREQRHAGLLLSMLCSDLFGLSAHALVWAALLEDGEHSLDGVYHQISQFHLPSFDMALPSLTTLPRDLDTNLGHTFLEFRRIKALVEGNRILSSTWDGESVAAGRANLLSVVKPFCETSMESYVLASVAANEKPLIKEIAQAASDIIRVQDGLKDRG